VKDLVVYCISASDERDIQMRSSLHRATPRGYKGVMGHYPVAGENLPAIVVKDISATVKNLQVFLPGDGVWWKENVAQGAANTPGTWS
jgi:hypothetical protein